MADIMDKEQILKQLGIEHKRRSIFKDAQLSVSKRDYYCEPGCPGCAGLKLIAYYEPLIEQARQDGIKEGINKERQRIMDELSIIGGRIEGGVKMNKQNEELELEGEGEAYQAEGHNQVYGHNKEHILPIVSDNCFEPTRKCADEDGVIQTYIVPDYHKVEITKERQRDADELILKRDYIKKDECNKLIEKELDYIIELTETIHRDYISKQSIRELKNIYSNFLEIAMRYVPPTEEQQIEGCVLRGRVELCDDLLTGDK